MELLYATGCRASELSKLKVRDIHLDEGYCRCHGKGDKERVVPVGRMGAEAVRDYLHKKGVPLHAMNTLALVYENLDNMRLATESYENAIRIAPRDYNVQNAYAVFHCKQRNFDEARKHFDRAIKVPENDASYITMTNAGVCMMQKPDVELAEQYFRQALERKSDHGEALLQMSLLNFTNGDYLGARAFLERYLGTNVPSAGVLLLGVRIEERLGLLGAKIHRAPADADTELLEYSQQAEPELRNRLLERIKAKDHSG